MIGNPPYGAKLTSEEKLKYRIQYPECQFKIDTYSLFLLHSTIILKHCGLSSFIIPNTLLDNYFEENVRKKLLLGNRIYEICDLNDKVFESAVVHAMILLYIRDNPNDDYKIKINTSRNLYDDVSYIPKSFFERQDKYVFQIRSHSSSDLFEKLQRNCERLENVLDIRQAIKSGNDSIYISDNKINEYYKPILRGKDVFRYSYKAPNKYIYYGKHLACPRSKEIFEQPKLLIREAGAIITATYDESNFYIMSSLYNAIPRNNGYKLKYLLALINSKLFQHLMNQFTFEKTKGAFTKAKIYHWYNLPVKKLDQQKIFVERVDTILKLKSEGQNDKAFYLENQIDNLIYKLYDLTYEEARVIDPKFGLSENEYENLRLD